MFDDTKLPCLSREIEYESLDFENLPYYYLGDEDEPVDVSGESSSNVHAQIDPRGGGVGNNTQSYMHIQSSVESTNQGGGSSSHTSNNLGGANELGSTSHTHHNFEQDESSRSNLSRQKVWNKNHPFHLIIGDPNTGV